MVFQDTKQGSVRETLVKNQLLQVEGHVLHYGNKVGPKGQKEYIWTKNIAEEWYTMLRNILNRSRETRVKVCSKISSQQQGAGSSLSASRRIWVF